MASRTLLPILTALTLAGCGQMGPLYLPNESHAETSVEPVPETIQGSPEAKEPDA